MSGPTVVCVFPQCPGHEDKLDTILHSLHHIASNQEKIMTEQQDIDAAVATDTALIADLATQVTAVQAAQDAFAAEIAALEAQGVDTSGLVAANAQLSAAQAPLDAAVAALTAASVPTTPPTDGTGNGGDTPPADTGDTTGE